MRAQADWHYEYMPRLDGRIAPLVLLTAVLGGTRTDAQSYRTWADYGGSPDSAQYSALTQITPANVSKLQVAWTFPTGDDNKYFFNPLVAGGRMYVLAKSNSIIALDPSS